MRTDLRAVVDSSGRVIGQALVGGNAVLGALHVLPARAPSAVTCIDEAGVRGLVRIDGVAATDPCTDLLVLRRGDSDQRNEPLDIVPFASLRTPVLVTLEAIVPSESGLRRAALRTTVLQFARVRLHQYTDAIGREVTAEWLQACILSDRLPRGTSGAPVVIEGTDRVMGFVHGNASATGGSAVALVPREQSPCLQVWAAGASRG